MNILVACKYGQGARDNDFNWCEPDEHVAIVGFECDGEDIDGNCGCRRSFSGLDSHRATTTCLVVDEPNMTAEELAAQIYASYETGGWLKLCTTEDELDEFRQEAIEAAKEVIDIAAHFKPGDVLERRGVEVVLRGGVPAIRLKHELALQKGVDNAGTRTESSPKRPAGKRSRPAKPGNTRPKRKAGKRRA